MSNVQSILGLSPDALGSLSLAELEDRARRAGGRHGLPLRDWAALAEAWRIAQVLRETHGNRAAAARALGIGRRTLYTKLERLGFVTDRGPDASAAPAASTWPPRRPLETR